MLEILGKYSDKTTGMAHTISSDTTTLTDTPENRKKQVLSICTDCIFWMKVF